MESDSGTAPAPRPPVLDQIEKLVDQLSRQEKLTLVERLTSKLKDEVSSSQKHKTLKGLWKDGFPTDFDVENYIREIRVEWKKELEESA